MPGTICGWSVSFVAPAQQCKQGLGRAWVEPQIPFELLPRLYGQIRGPGLDMHPMLGCVRPGSDAALTQRGLLLSGGCTRLCVCTPHRQMCHDFDAGKPYEGAPAAQVKQMRCPCLSITINASHRRVEGAQVSSRESTCTSSEFCSAGVCAYCILRHACIGMGTAQGCIWLCRQSSWVQQARIKHEAMKWRTAHQTTTPWDSSAKGSSSREGSGAARWMSGWSEDMRSALRAVGPVLRRDRRQQKSWPCSRLCGAFSMTTCRQQRQHVPVTGHPARGVCLMPSLHTPQQNRWFILHHCRPRSRCSYESSDINSDQHLTRNEQEHKLWQLAAGAIAG